MTRDPHQIDLEDYDGVRSPGYVRPEDAAPGAPAAPARAISAKRMIPPFEQQRRVLPVDMEFAARQIVKDFLLANVGERATPSAGRPGKRDLSTEIRDAKATIELIRAQFGDQVIRDIEWFIAAVTTRPDGTPMRFADSGAEIAPGKSPEAQKWAGYGALFRTLTVLVRFYARQRALGKVNAPATEADRKELQVLLSTLAQQRRIRGK